jgi:hypothetical protein
MTVVVNEGNDVQLDGLLRHVAVMLPELPYEVALDMVRERYIELARKSGVLRWYYELPLQAGVTNYFIEPPAGYEVYSINEYGDLFRETWWPWAETPHYWNIAWGYRMRALSNTQILFERAPTRDETGRYIRTTLIPTSCATSIPAAVATPWGRGIAAGAVATALLMPSRAWSNPGLAQKHELDFNRAVLGAKNLVLTERGTKPAQFRPLRIL